jgi:LytR cell envelope-related transcriptional attenuator
MSHSAPPGPTKRRWEVAGGAAVVFAGVIALLFAFVALHHPKGRTESRASAVPSTSTPSASLSKSASKPHSSQRATSPSASASKPTSAANSAPQSVSQLPVIVLNNTSDQSKTTDAVDKLHTNGWTVSDGGWFDGSILSTAVYYDPDVAGAEQAAEQLQSQFPQIQRVKPKFDGLPAGPLVLMVTTDYS